MYILTLQDDLTKFSAAYAIKSTDAETIAKTLVENFICYFGIPLQILSDQGTNFLSTLFKQVCKLLGIKKLQTTAYSPTTNGALERSHKTLKEYLRNFIDKKKQNWCTYLSYAMFTYNTTPHTSHNFTPFELVFGIQPIIPSTFAKSPNIPYNYTDYVTDLKHRMQESRQMAREHLISSKNKNKDYYDKKINPINVKIGDKVLMKNMNKKNKLEQHWLGPFEVVEINSPVNVSILKNNKKTVVHMNHLKLFNQ